MDPTADAWIVAGAIAAPQTAQEAKALVPGGPTAVAVPLDEARSGQGHRGSAAGGSAVGGYADYVRKSVDADCDA